MSALQPLLDWLAAHPKTALGVVAFACFFDALLVVGFLVPSYVFLLGIGALIALEALPFWPTLLAAAGGALSGDLLNYWLGRRHLDRWMTRRFLQRYRGSIDNMQRFFLRRGGLALFGSRLIGPIRPFGPMIAGAAPMALPRFVAWAVPACLLWATTFILPGVAIGASLQMAAEVATRLALLLIGAIGLALALSWLVALLVRGSALYSERLLHRLLAWSERHRRLGMLPRWLTDPGSPETPALLVVALLLLGAGWLGLVLTWGWTRDTPMAVDALVYSQLAQLHHPVSLAVAGWLAHLGALPVVLVAAAAVLITLLAGGRVRAAAHVVAALAFGGLIALVLGWSLRAPAPVAFYGSSITSSGYRGADLILFTVVVGLLPVLLGRRRRPAWNLIWYRTSALLLFLVAGAQLYIGAQWFSVAAGSLGVGLLWMLALGIGYRRHGVLALSPWRLLPVMLLAYLAALLSLWPDTARAPALAPVVTLDTQQWWEEDWRHLPRGRGDATGRDRQPLTVQWLAEPESRDAALHAAGWESAVPLGWDNWPRLLATSAPLETLPLPQQQLGLRPPQATFLRQDNAQSLTVLRLWEARATADGLPVWLGSLSRMRARNLLGIARLPYTADAALDPGGWLGTLEGFAVQHRAAPDGGPDTLLLRPLAHDSTPLSTEDP